MSHSFSISSILAFILGLSVHMPLMGQHRTAGQAIQIARQYLTNCQVPSAASLSLMATSGQKCESLDPSS